MDRQKRSELMKNYKSRKVVGGVCAITNNVTGKRMLSITADIQGSRNRFEFAQQMNSCIHPRLKDDWQNHGGSSFRFDVVEKLEKKEGQTDSEFQEDLNALFAIAYEGVQPDRYE